MEMLDSIVSEGSATTEVTQRIQEEEEKFLRKNFLQLLMHAGQCEDSSCRVPKCKWMKWVVTHLRTCEDALNLNCRMCSQLVNLCALHAKICQDTQCPVKFCRPMKVMLMQRQPELQIMEIPFLDLSEGSSKTDIEEILKEEVLKFSTKIFMHLMVHAGQCEDANCPDPKCLTMQKNLVHLMECETRPSGGCKICSEIESICRLHATLCQDDQCSIEFCSSMKQKLQNRANKRKRIPDSMQQKFQNRVNKKRRISD